MRLGAKKLGLKTHWNYAFVGAGEVVAPFPGTVLLDVGGSLQAGALDSHQGGAATASELVLQFPQHVYDHLLGAWLRRREKGEDLADKVWEPQLVTHTSPDFDSVVATFLAQRLVEDGSPPAYAKALAAYAAIVDRGAYPIELDDSASYTVPVHMAYLMLQCSVRDHRKCLELGVKMVTAVCDALAVVRRQGWQVTAFDFTPHRLPAESTAPETLAALTQAAAAWRDVLKVELDEGAEDIPTTLGAQAAAYLEDKTAAKARGGLTTARVPTSAGAGESLEIQAFIAAGVPSCKLNKYFVRADGYPLFVCPLAPFPGAAPDTSRVITSLDPNYRDARGRAPSLRGLGYRLEREECAKRQTLGRETRIPVPRWSDGSVDNADPWYDGRGHEHAIVDAPGGGSLLSYQEICAVVTGGDFWKTRLEHAWVALVVPDAEGCKDAARSGGSAADLGGLSPALRPWHAESPVWSPSTRGLPWLEAPVAFTEERSLLRSVPGDLAVPGAGSLPALRVVEFHGQAGRSTLDDLAAWVESLASQHAQLYVVATVTPERGAPLDERTGELLARICRGESDRVTRAEDDELVLLNGRVVAVHRGGGRDVDSRHQELLRDLMVYAAFQETMLLWFSERVAAAVPVGSAQGRTPGDTSALRQAFLRFGARYVTHEPTLLSDARQEYQAVAAALGLERAFAKVKEEMAALEKIDEDHAEAQRRKAEQSMTFVLGVVALGGIIQAASVDFSSLGWPKLITTLALCVVGGAAIFYDGWRLRRVR